MSLFKDKILSQYIQDEQVIEERYAALQAFQSKAEDIRHFKEEQYQTGFLEDIFEQCLGYTLKIHNPKQYNLEREKKDETDGKKADAVIYNTQGEVIGVIELKDQKTQDLEKVVSQAFHYHRNHEQSKYIIISNFNELRFYIDKQTAYEEFNLFTMNKDEFRRFYLILNYQSILHDLPIKLKQQTDNADNDISKKLYADFSAFRLQLFENAKQNNPNISQKKLLRLIQKFCDRIIFILFAEDKGLLKPNTIAEIGQRHTQIKGIAEISLYQIYQKYFQAIDKGNTDLGIMPYNGGLFREDSELNQLTISDNILETHLPKLSAYDFKSDISVNILGHIFEQSLSDLEELNAAIDNQQFDYNQSKRKKDGIFYTPEYITQFIVEQTIGKICEEKKQALGLNKEIRLTEKIKKKLNKEEQNLLDRLYQYRNFLLELKIIDPACGSGAFLNQALEFLIKEHAFIDKYRRILENESLGLYDIEIAILENNLYGVDINADAVEIAKLSLWLRTAQKGRKLTDLSNNIICANSLLALPFKNDNADTPTVIASLDASQGVRNLPTMENAPKPHSDKEIATPATQARNDGNDFSGSLKAFPQKFDCVIGNPPYIRVQGLKAHHENESKLYEQNFVSATGNYDIYVLFMEQGVKLLKETGKCGFILPHKFLISDFGKGIREFLSQNKALEKLYHFGSHLVFEDASTYTCISILSQDNQFIKFKHLNPNELSKDLDLHEISYDNLNSNKWNLTDKQTANILQKINNQPLKVKDIFSKIFQGIATSGDDIYLLLKTEKGLYSKALDKIVEIESGLLKPLLKGEDIKRYADLHNRYFVIFPYLLENEKAIPMSEEYIKTNFPKGYEYLKENETFLRGREKGKMNKDGWFLYIYPKSLNLIDKEKLVVPDITLGIQITFDKVGYCVKNGGYGLVINEKFLECIKFYLAILNSQILWFYLKNSGTELRGGYFRFNTNYINPFGLPKLNNINEQQPFIELADKMLSLNAELNDKKSRFMRRLQQNFANIKIKGGLTQFWQLSFADFVNELKKQKIKLTLAEQDEWEDYFTQYQNHCTALQQTISQTDKTIDQMVYQLYGLTDDEIKIVEQA